jgi:prepilin-type N-terminal cleavage/methylation domain-containing protein
MKRAVFTNLEIFVSAKKGGKAGFTLVELLITVSIIGVISAVAIPAVSYYREDCCVKAAIYETAGMFKEAKQNAVSDGKDYGITFNTADGIISLVSGKGADGVWNTPDDPVVRSFRLAQKGSGLKFSHGNYGPLPTLVAAPDGVSFDTNNTCVCNPELTGNAGTVYIMSASGSAMALKMNSTAFGYFMYRWNGKRWTQM